MTINLTGNQGMDGSVRVTTDFKYLNTATASTYVANTGPGYLHLITINTGLSGGTATIYDSATGTGTLIATINTSSTGTFVYDVDYNTGLTIVTSSAPNMTISYK